MKHEIKVPHVFNDSLRALEAADRGHPNTFNPAFAQLANNDAYLKEHVDGAAGAAKAHADDGGIHVTDEQKDTWSGKAENAPVTPEEQGLMSAADKTKLDTVEPGAEANQLAVSVVKTGTTVISANSKTAQINLVAGTNITIDGDNATKNITVSAAEAVKNPNALTVQTDGTTQAVYDGSEAKTVNITPSNVGAAPASHSHSSADESEPGYMSSADKTKLDTVEPGAEVNQLAVSAVKAGTAVISADSKTAQVEFIAGDNITITGSDSTKQVTIAAEGGGNYIGAAPPAKKNLLWTDTGSGGVLKYWNGSAWVPMKSVWG